VSIRRDAPVNAPTKSGIFKPAPQAPDLSQSEFDLRLAEELDYAARQIAHLGDVLASDPALVARHGYAIQSIDLVNQNLGRLSNVIKFADKESAVDRMSSGDLKARLTRKAIIPISFS